MRGWVWLVFVAVASSEFVREFTVPEGAKPTTLVGHIGDELPDAPPPYTIVPVPGSAVASDLDVNHKTGEIRTKVPLDRETRDSYSMVAIPLSGDNIRVLVKVLDENDNAPTFPSPTMHVEFSENTPRDVKRKLNPAKDPDLGSYNTQRYNIVSGNTENAFRLSSHRERDGVLYLDLQINGFLDRETTDSYELVIEALDGGSPPLRGNMTVYIAILDVNDNPPVFAETSYSATVPENATIGTSVVKVAATDADSGENGHIEYSINRRQSDKENMFRIDPQTGEITVNKALDFETKELHEIVVVARDKGAQPLETSAFVSIKVTDVNDNQPTIDVIFLSDDATPKISEAAQLDEFVARISVHDPDSKTEYSNVNVTLSGGDGHFDLRTHDNVIYLVIVALPLDRESEPFYTLNVVATDKGSPPLHASREIRLRVTDVNDNPPIFTENEYKANVPEASALGTLVTQVKAIDVDENENANVKYYLLPTAQSDWFAIDESSGLITTKSRVNCEINPMPRLTIVAKDSGNPPLSSSATLIVTVLDVNDNEPIFDQSFYNVTVQENEPVGNCILKMSAMDPDCGVNAIVNYTLGESSDLRHFRMTPDTGDLCISAPLDYESANVFEFPVIATDKGGLSTTAMVKIQLLDINDNAPKFTSFEYNVSVREGRVTTSEPIIATPATDLDSGRFGSITYRLSAGNENDIFRIERSSGEIFVARPSTLSTKNKYRLEVSATDGGGLTTSQAVVVYVTVIPAGAGPAFFDKPRYHFKVREDVQPGTPLGSLKAGGCEQDKQNVHFSIASGDQGNQFVVDPNSCNIKTTGRLDREAKSSYLLSIEAASGSLLNHDRAQVQIEIEDVNDNPPQFGATSVRISVAEGAAIGAVIYAARAHDTDIGINSHITYSLLALTGPPGTFSINPQLGLVTLLRPLDYEAVVIHTLVITAKDSGTPFLSANLTLIVDVQDINDNAPIFQQDLYTTNVLESEPIGFKILEVQAIDSDTGNNARVTYKLTPEFVNGTVSEEYFGMVPGTGWISLTKALDREVSAIHKMTLTAVDNGIPPLSATVKVVITVLDANDNDPKFSRSAYQFEVEENQVTGAFVGRISALDIDFGDNALIYYSLLPSTTNFNIDHLTGKITTKDSLDREIKKTYSIFAEAKDQGTPSRASRVPVSIIVTDVNDNSPEIIDPREDVISVREEQQPGAEVAKVIAVDRDEGANATIKYSIISDHDSDGYGVFSIDYSSGIITTKKILDHEERSIYRLTVAATDGGLPPRQAIRQLKVEVLDLNDNRPTFTSSSVTFMVREDAKIGQVVGSVICCEHRNQENFISNADTHVTFQLLSIKSDRIIGSFDIDRRTGSLVIAGQLDREIQDEYRLEVRTLDTSCANNPQSSAVTINIDIIDVNDNFPKWQKDPLIIYVPEDLTFGSVIYNFTAFDLDAGLNGDVTYSLLPIVDKNTSDLFSIDTLTGELTLKSYLDFEDVKEHVVIVQATDMAANISERLTSAVTLHMFVTDTNDNVPYFVSTNEVYVAFNKVYEYIYKAWAVDLDSGDNGRVSYSIVNGNENGYFKLDGYNGKIYLTNKFRLDEKLHPSQYKLNLTASDHGSPPKKTYMVLSITLLEATNNPPRFIEPYFKVNISEDIRIGGFVTRVTAKPSHGSTGNITFSIPPGAADDNFSVDEQRGIVTTRRKLDREEKDIYMLPVYATDTTNSYSSANFDVSNVIINLIDVNDNPPIFKEGSCYQLTVPENNEVETIHTVVATDQDIGSNGILSYSITSGNIGSKFSIDALKGHLTARPLDRETQSKYHLTITAYDHGTPVALQGSCNITISVSDRNDNDPIFDSSKYMASVSEDSLVDSSVLKVHATDADKGRNSRIVYSLANESQGLFSIDNKTGIISTAGSFDREKQNIYNFHVVATDEGRYNARYQKVPVEIIIKDINDNRPIFSEYPFKEHIAALSPPGQSLLKVVASDNDEGINAEILYELLDSNNQKFRINPTTGIVTNTQSLASENGKLIHLKVMAKDKGLPPQSSVGLIEIRVGDLPESFPSLNFQSKHYNVSIPENLPNKRDIFQVTAVRSDGRRQHIIYEFGNGNDDHAFEIDIHSGLIRVADSAKLDYEGYLGPTRKLVVVARTETNPFLYGYCEVAINFLDQNDNAPRFTQQQYRANVWEGNSKGEFVVQLSAKDVDEGINARVLYHIVDGNHDNAFMIEPAFSGSVKTNIVLDREIRESYKLTVIATDEGVPQMTGTATLRIDIVDINDNQPTFPPKSSTSVFEDTPVGTMLTAVTANDVDTFPPLKYALLNEEDTFSVDKYSGKVILNKKLDYEERTLYELNITATDTVHIAKTTLTVKVLDVNDNSPIFEQVSYRRILPEGYGIKEIATLIASDRDSGENGRVTYTLEPSIQGYYIDENTGIVYVNYSSLPTSNRNVQLRIKGTDNGQPKKCATASLKISDTNLPNVRPSIDQNIYRITVNENTVKGTTVLQLGVDSNYNKNQQLIISSGNEGEAFETSDNGAIILIKELDRETLDSYTLSLATIENNNIMSYPQNKSIASIYVTVTDANDNPPKFDDHNFDVSVSESVKIGHTLTQITANDADLFGSENSAITYMFTSGNDENLFDIHPKTGTVTVNKTLDYDIGYTKYPLVVMACDEGVPSLCSVESFTVKLLDENDNWPKFPVSEYYESVSENSRVGSSVFVARASDLDKGKYGILNYSLSELAESYSKKEKSSKLFEIDPLSGLLSTNTIFDYEHRQNYIFMIKATDAGGKFSTVKIQLDIDSKDEFYPQFTQTTYRFPVGMPKSGYLPSGFVVGQVTATDGDKGIDGRVVYQFSTPSSYFKINRTNGYIIVKRKIDNLANLFEQKVINLVVTASSGRQDSLTNKTAVDVVLDPTAFIIDSINEPTVTNNGLSDWAVGLLIAFIFIIIIFAAIFVFLHMKNKKHKKISKPGLASEGVGGANNYVDPSAFDTIPIRGGNVLGVPNQFSPPKYDEIPPYGPHTASSNSGAPTTSELSGSEQSGSSGRGSAEDGEDGEDEEIRMINEGNLQRGSGIQRPNIRVEDDNLSDVSVHNTQEYLARLGIVNSGNGRAATASSRRCSESVGIGSTKDSLMQGGVQMEIFDEDTNNDHDINNLIYAKLNDVSGSERTSNIDEVEGVPDRAMALGVFPNPPRENSGVPTHGPSMTGSLSSIVHSEEELTGSYNWDYLQDWGPQYQPLAHVFSEIARLKDDAVSMASGNSGGSSVKSKGTSVSAAKSVPSHSSSAAPRSYPQQTLSCRPPQHIIPRSPINHDISSAFSTGNAMSPSFSPALSPLSNRSPTMSPLGAPGLPPVAANRKFQHSTLRL